jgi:hypothetical protein
LIVYYDGHGVLETVSAMGDIAVIGDALGSIVVRITA